MKCPRCGEPEHPDQCTVPAPAGQNPDCAPAVVARYQGIRQPYCHGGDGCKACWDKWYEARQLEQE